ncbi:DUF58 domain-containing protein [Evansella sp. AB-rgal1]|uniref:DUF58 domain-containing protein n=1 Tax=Evansella sp. AB-rgal1 TaxID=3242696 RepID=UPI00359D0BE9
MRNHLLILLPKNKEQRPFFYSVVIIWFSSLLFFLFTGGKLAFMLFTIVTILSVYLISLEKWSGIMEIKGERIIDQEGMSDNGRLETGDTIQVKMEYLLPGFWPLTHVFVKDSLHHHQLGVTTHESSFVPNSYRKGDITYSVKVQRGAYVFGTTECTTSDVFQLQEHKSVMDLSAAFRVFPKTIPISYWEDVHTVERAAHQLSSSLHYQRETTQIDGVREYVHGDRLSHIHWNATAKTGELKSKEFEREARRKTVVILDRHIHSYSDDNHFELAVSVCASLITYMIRKQKPVGLHCYENYIEPSVGKKHHYRLEEHLLHVYRDGKMPIYQLINNRRKLVPGTVIAVVTPVASEALYHQLRFLKHMNLQPCHFFIGKQRKQGFQKWERSLAEEGINVYSVSTLDDLRAVLGGKLHE